MAPAAHALSPGHELFEYRIESLLASGALGLTYIAQDTQMNVRVVIREYLPIDIAARGQGATIEPLFPREGDLLRQGTAHFMEESRRLGSVRHPNIVRVLRLFEANGTAYMVCEYESGMSLVDWRAKIGRPTEASLSRILLPVLDGLHALHDAGIHHGDMKPGRVRLRADGAPVILDFGAAHHVRIGRARDSPLQVTPGYAPIETYYTSGKRGPWSDLYSVAAIAYWAITGDRPQEAPERALADKTPRLRGHVDLGSLSADFLAAIDWALEVDPDKRPRDAQTLRRALAPGGMDVADVARTKSHPNPVEAVKPMPGEPRPASTAALPTADASVEFVPDPDQLTRAKIELVHHLGPIANVVVRKALSEATDWRDFCVRAATQINGEAARRAFLEKFSATSAKVGDTQSIPPKPVDQPARTTSAVPPEVGYEADLLAALEAEVAGHLGAIAKIVVKRSASKARNRGELYELIAAELDDRERARKFVAWAESRFGLR